MKIKSIKLLGSGLKGMKVVYIKAELKDNLHFYNDYAVNYKYPAGKKFKDALALLAAHAHKMMNMNCLADDLVCEEVVIDDKKGIQIKSTQRVLHALFTNVNTPFVGAKDGYPDHEQLQEDVLALIELVKEYAKKKEAVDVQQFIIDFNAKKDNGFDQENVEQMSHEEKLALYRETLEKAGMIVLGDEISSKEEDPGTGAEEEDLTGPGDNVQMEEKKSPAKTKVKKEKAVVATETVAAPANESEDVVGDLRHSPMRKVS